MTATTPQKKIQLLWEAGSHANPKEEPTRWIAAQVPGAVQLDWSRAEGWEPFWRADEYKKYIWMEDTYWSYRCVLPDVELPSNATLNFICKGIDYQFEIDLAGRLVFAQEGMFTPIHLNLTGLGARSGDELRVRVFPVPKSVPAPANRDQANASCKPAVSYGWDFHPRLVPLGIWGETHLEIQPIRSIDTVEMQYELSPDLSSAAIEIDVAIGAATAGRIEWQLMSTDGAVVAQATANADRSSVRLRATVKNPALWWPHDQGVPYLYESIVRRLDGDGAVLGERRSRVGFRRTRLLMNHGAWIEPSRFPKSRSTPPIALEINNRLVFAKGSNWVSPHIFPGALGRNQYETQLNMVRDANMNILRMWGGATIQKQEFYDLADELGIMIWQEFPLACNRYPDHPAYLRVLDQESRSIIRSLRTHPCIILWCGGNELFNNWSGMTDQSLPLRLLNRNCFELDRDTPFLATSPLMGMGHGHYVFRDDTTGEEAWQLFQNATCTAYTEFGCAGPAGIETIKAIIPESELFPPKRGTNWEEHNAFGQWMPDSHLYLNTIEHYWGPSENLEQIIKKGQVLQCEGYKGLFEEVRRQQPRASMAINWCLNEPWPTAANNSLVSWPSVAKPSLAAVGESCRPILASARLSHYLWKEGELFDPELWLLSDSPEAAPAGTIDAWLLHGGEKIHLLSWRYGTVSPATNIRGPRIQLVLPKFAGNAIDLSLECDNAKLNSRYRLAYRPLQETGKKAVIMNLG